MTTEEAIMKMIEMVQRPCSNPPTDMWHPDYGWIIKDGKPTENAGDFYREMIDGKE